MKLRFVILLILILLFLFSGWIWYHEATTPVSRATLSSQDFIIHQGEGLRSIATRLEQQGLIRSSTAFFLYTRTSGLAKQIQAGYFRLSPSMNAASIAEILTHGSTDVRVTVPEGWRNAEIALKLAKELSIPEEEFIKDAEEGFMFPDTYLIPRDSSAAAVVAVMKKNFNSKISADLVNNAKQKNLNVHDLITIASLVEREAQMKEDRSLVASVIINRLKIGMKLDIDATVQYALNYQPDQKTWWKKNLTLEDIAINSPYNTHTHPGLPPTPIANPGLDAITSVINAPKTNYLYYISDAKGFNHYAETLDEHNANIRKYLDGR